MDEDNTVAFLPQGAIIQEFRVAGHNIVQGFKSAESYKTLNTPYFGETIGRVANRISGAKINNLNGQSYAFTANNGPNILHSGAKGWGKHIFDGPTPVNRNGRESVLFKYLSKDGEEGFPGTVELRVWYICGIDKADGKSKTSVELEYEVELVGDEVEETVVNVTNHSYFNLGSGPTIEGTKGTLYSNLHLPSDEYNIPHGPIEPYPDIAANQEFTLGPEEPAPDHCFIVNDKPSTVPLDTRKEPLRKLCEFHHPSTGIHLEAYSTEPAFQFYTGTWIDVPATSEDPARGARSGFCIEASRYVDAINVDDWRHMVVLKKGQVWGSRTVYRAWKE